MRTLPAVAAIGLAAAAFAAPSPAPAAPAPDEKPFPVAKTTILNEEKVVYIVDGRVRIPKGVTITCQKDVHVKAKAGTKAVIEVEGTLEFQGVASREVILEGVTVEPCATFKEVNIDSAIFRGGGGLRTREATAVDGKIFLELSAFEAGCGVVLSMSGGSLDIATCSFSDPVIVRGVDPPNAKGNRVRVNVRGCVAMNGRVGFGGGLVVDNVADVVLRSSLFGGALTAIRDWDGALLFDANKVKSDALEFTHSEAGRMGSVTVVKCDVYSQRVAAKCPPSKDVKDVLAMDRCWFRGESDAKALAEKVVVDGAKDPANGARIALVKINPRPHELAGPVER